MTSSFTIFTILVMDAKVWLHNCYFSEWLNSGIVCKLLDKCVVYEHASAYMKRCGDPAQIHCHNIAIDYMPKQVLKVCHLIFVQK